MYSLRIHDRNFGMKSIILSLSLLCSTSAFTATLPEFLPLENHSQLGGIGNALTLVFHEDNANWSYDLAVYQYWKGHLNGADIILERNQPLERGIYEGYELFFSDHVRIEKYISSRELIVKVELKEKSYTLNFECNESFRRCLLKI